MKSQTHSSACRTGRRATFFSVLLSQTRKGISDQKGVAAIEFALVCLPLFALILASLVMSVVYFTQSALDAVSDQLSREILTGQAPASGNAAQFKSQACAVLPSYMSCSNLLVNVRSVSSFADASTTAPQLSFDSSGAVTNSMSYDPGTAGSIVVFELMYMLPVMKSLDGFTAATLNNGSRLIISTAVIKVEPSS
ncbi:TadE/TadG family type IV pilus assembly protein [Acetobacter sp.]|jgi:Flp pilus assembly protein TadG|uniref:TadE/TadG family type IV pilus assembly protein n=1 Tax=Acetobacter sp. TaxID=440 RepID=UPI0025BE3F0F|nr:TadE/TadG family type IV pilus assembly protein [Acetobacter sp.]MCH4090687.1 pilus assembly protein [Acetobacter sp.]MCI1300130.1 pilus assembly protein [Acetobacter sp.]MCI1316548.1 pilus assembly protein [Acetobacter sp.]